ncbi:MAG TPA: hypothetical protein PLL77_14530 [Pyrinomonadaceae bacterium]|nr:hypothetical protein [Pyrinomonadaceae bacterium]
MKMCEMWTYDKEKRLDRKGRRWHFVHRDIHGVETPYEERPYELYFRNDEKTAFGVLRFQHRKDNPYRDYMTVVTKIMNNDDFRMTLLDPETENVWNRNWK